MYVRYARAAAVSMMLACGSAAAQGYPAKPIKVTTTSAGSPLDLVLRTIGNGIMPHTGQPFVVDNKPTTVHPEDAIAKGVPDGYSLGYFTNAVWLAPFLRADLPYDPLKDFAPISLTVVSASIVTVGASVPANSVAELVALAKARPGELNVYFSSPGGAVSLAALLFQAATNTKLTQVPYKSTTQGMNDLVAGRLQVIFVAMPTLVPFVKTGKLKMLAVASKQRIAQAPDLPTMASLGYPDFEVVSAQSLFAPPRTPPEIVNRLNREIVSFLGSPEARSRLGAMGVDITASSPAELSRFMKAEMDRIGPVLKAAGIEPGDGE